MGTELAIETKSGLSDRARANLLSLAGTAIILLSAGAALLPAANGLKDWLVIGSLLLTAGAIEGLGGTLRRSLKPFAEAAGAVTALVGLLFIVSRSEHFFPTVALIIAWLVIRGIIIAVGSRRATGSVRTWTILSAGVDFLLAALLVAGLSIATIIVSIFGPTPPLIASFAWVLAASFIANGLMLLEVASSERESRG